MDATETAYIAAGAALFGALIGAGSAFGIELWRAGRLRKKEAAERLLEALTENIGATFEWILKTSFWLTIPANHLQAPRFIEEAEAAAARARGGVITLRFLAPQAVLEWIETTYNPSIKKLAALIDQAIAQRTDDTLTAVQSAIADYHTVVNDAQGMLRREVDLLRSKKES